MMIRATMDFVTGSEGETNGWYWAFVISLLWPMIGRLKNKLSPLLCKSVTEVQNPDPVIDGFASVPVTPSARSYATSQTASDSVRSQNSAGDVTGEQCDGSGVLLSKERDQPLAAAKCTEKTSQWCRLHQKDGRCQEVGKTNRFDGQEWVRMCPEHKDKYEEWVLARQCNFVGCDDTKAGTIVDGKASKFCMQHTEKQERVCETTHEAPHEDRDSRTLDMHGKAETPEYIPKDDGNSLGRVMNLQRRAMRGRESIKKRGSAQSNEMTSRSQSECSGRSAKSSASGKLGMGTQLTPDREPESKKTKETEGRQRRNSTGDVTGAQSTGMLPFELVKKPIRPLLVPLASDQCEIRVATSTENELIVNRLEAIDDKKDPERQWNKVTKYSVFAARGFGTFNPTIGRGVYGIELQKALRRQANSLKHTLWDLKIRVPITNRIASGMALINWGAEDGVHGSKDAIMLGDCYPLDSQNFESFRISGDKTEDHGKQPATVHMFVKMARQQSRLYADVYGEEHLNERLNAIDRMSDIHDECPEFSTASFLSETWERMVYQYDACIAEGIHYILGRYDEGVTFEKVKRYALAPDAKQGTSWRSTPIFDFDSSDGFWRSVVLLEISQERQRQDINALVAARGKALPGGKRKNDERAGGVEEEKPRAQYPMGQNLSVIERKAGFAHKPLDKNGKTL